MSTTSIVITIYPPDPQRPGAWPYKVRSNAHGDISPFASYTSCASRKDAEAHAEAQAAYFRAFGHFVTIEHEQPT